MNSIKCASCGLVLWADTETCKRCGAIIHPQNSPPETATNNENSDREIPTKRVNPWARRLLALAAMLTVLAVLGASLVLRKSKPDEPKVFVLNDGTKKTSKVWFHGWFSDDPSADQILDYYLKVTGWDNNPEGLKSYVANGRFEIRSENNETIVTSPTDPLQLEMHYHWGPSKGEVELKAVGLDKLVITQRYDEKQVFQRGTTGETAWWRKGSADPDAPAGAPLRLLNPTSGELRGATVIDLRNGADFINYVRLRPTDSGLSFRGKAKVGDRVCYEIHGKAEGGPSAIMFFDVETGMLLKFLASRQQKPWVPSLDRYLVSYTDPSYFSETYLEDYREVNGIRIPFLIRQRVEDLWVTTTISEFKANEAIALSEFQKPLP